jgi:hypothetical protein
MKKTLNTQNYTDWFLAYSDNTLTKEELLFLYEFMYKHPAILEEWEEWLEGGTLQLVADNAVSFPHKNLLLKQPDNNTDPFLRPDTAISFPNKSLLLKKAPAQTRTSWIPHMANLAACLTLLFLCFEPSPINPTQKGTYPLAKATIESKPMAEILTVETTVHLLSQSPQKQFRKTKAPATKEDTYVEIALQAGPVIALTPRSLPLLSPPEVEPDLSVSPALAFKSNYLYERMTKAPSSYYVPQKTRQYIAHQINTWIVERVGISPFENDIYVQIKLGQFTFKPHKISESSI